jgi:carboxyl-terminal processing protease
MKLAHLSLIALVCLQYTQSAMAIPPSKYDEVKWAPTELNPRLIDGTITFDYCKFELMRFKGCVAAVEMFSHSVDKNNEILLENGKFIISKTRDIDLERSDFKKYQANRRKKYDAFDSAFNNVGLSSLVAIYADLRKQNANPLPYQIADSLNEYFAVAFDPHKLLQPMDRYDGSMRISQKPYIGVELIPNGHNLEVKKVMVNTPAELAGIKPGDIITQTDGNDLNITSDDAENFFDFQENQVVKLTVKRKNRTFKVDVTFGYKGITPVVDREIEYNNEKYTYLYMSQIPWNQDLTADDQCSIFEDMFKKFNESSDGMILDLRDNIGGEGRTAACIVGLFTKKGTHVFTEINIYDESETVYKTTLDQAFKKKLVVLVNEKTASSGEIMTGFLQFYGRAPILGNRTYGKGIGQFSEDWVMDRSTLYETTTKAVYPDGTNHQAKGITPDLFVYKKGLKISQSEKNALREEDNALYPLRFSPSPSHLERPKAITLPTECISDNEIRSEFNKLADTDWKRDMQLQYALKTISCMK